MEHLRAGPAGLWRSWVAGGCWFQAPGVVADGDRRGAAVVAVDGQDLTAAVGGRELDAVKPPFELLAQLARDGDRDLLGMIE
jgi:hypothetical protein